MGVLITRQVFRLKVTKIQCDLAPFRQQCNLLAVNRGYDPFYLGILGVEASINQLFPSRVQRLRQLTGTEMGDAARNDDRRKQSRTGNALNLAKFAALQWLGISDVLQRNENAFRRILDHRARNECGKNSRHNSADGYRQLAASLIRMEAP